MFSSLAANRTISVHSKQNHILRHVRFGYGRLFVNLTNEINARFGARDVYVIIEGVACSSTEHESAEIMLALMQRPQLT